MNIKWGIHKGRPLQGGGVSQKRAHVDWGEGDKGKCRLHSIQNYTAFKYVSEYSYKVPIRGSLPNLVRAALYVRFAAPCFSISSDAFLDLRLITKQVVCVVLQDP